MICDLVVDCLGRELVVIQAYPDGSYNCPSCRYAVQAHEPHCPNPACFTRPGYPPEHARAAIAAELERKRVELERVRVHELRMREVQAAREHETRQLAEIATTARERGACVRCALHSARFGHLYSPRYVKHRSACPRER